RLLLHADDPPHLHVSLSIRTLRMDDGGVGHQGGNGCQHLTGERTLDRPDGVGVRGQIRAGVAPKDGKREAGGSGEIPVGHARVTVLLQLESTRPTVFDGIAKTVERADSGVTSPGEHELDCAPHAEELVVYEIRVHANQDELAPSLPNDFMARG